ncbi:MAG: hypothetical protein NUV48_14145, partial [Peptococcaceae bacterium]|nr:hypothetical protein [Peptococcaceae bacterium]
IEGSQEGFVYCLTWSYSTVDQSKAELYRLASAYKAYPSCRSPGRPTIIPGPLMLTLGSLTLCLSYIFTDFLPN